MEQLGTTTCRGVGITTWEECCSASKLAPNEIESRHALALWPILSKLLQVSTIDSANPPQEFPDIVRARPTNPRTANFKSFVPPSAHLPELTWPYLITGTILGIIFGASSLYLVLKVGSTVSASIAVAVLSITIFRIASKLLRSRDATILQNNIVQTAGSAGEPIAFGLGVTMPAIMILGFDLEITRVVLVAVLGGLLGILMMIPLRRA